jgi:hypothetical protein
MFVTCAVSVRSRAPSWACYQPPVKALERVRLIASDLLITFGLVITAGYWLLYPIGLLPRACRRGRASGGGRRRGVDRAHPAGQSLPLGAAGRDSHQDTGTQTSTFCEYPAEPYAPAPAGPLRSELPPTCVTAAWCVPIAMVLAREVGAPSNMTWGFTMHLLVTGKAHHRSGTFHSRHTASYLIP